MKNKSTYSMNALVLCSAMLLACGDDDSASTTGDRTDGGADATVASFPDAATDSTQTGTGGTISSSGTGGSMMPAMRIPCGQNSCTATTALGLPSCCAEGNVCGTMMGNTCTLPPKVDPSCPSVTIPVAGDVGSCCADNGKCGLDGSLFGMGCVDYEALKSSLGVLGGVLTLPAEQSCGESERDAGADEDAGH
jgi:hypothetical protein